MIDAQIKEKAMSAWSVKSDDFPYDGTSSEKLAFLIQYGVLAHSTYNSQPWYFKVKQNVVSVYIDRRHALPVIDPDDREAVMACSGAMYHLRLAIKYFGYKEVTEIFPESKDTSLIGRVTLGEKLDDDTSKDEVNQSLFEAIPTRHLNFSAFTSKPVEDTAISKLKQAAEKEGAWLHVCNDYERVALGSLIIEGDHMQMSDKKFRRELAGWLDPRRFISKDGMPCEELDFNKMLSRYTTSSYRRFESEDRSVVSDDELNDEIPVMAILGCAGGGMVERIYAGQALARVLLRAEAEGLSVSLLNQPCEVPELRLRLHDEISQAGRAQAILRIGYGGKSCRTPRRLASEVTEISGKLAANSNHSDASDQKDKKSGFLGRFARLFVAKS
jgi:hypothetical protein